MAVEAKCGIEFNQQECTGCGVCLGSCKRDAWKIGSMVNRYGVHPVEHRDEACEGCGICYYLCPEPGAITLFN